MSRRFGESTVVSEANWFRKLMLNATMKIERSSNIESDARHCRQQFQNYRVLEDEVMEVREPE